MRALARISTGAIERNAARLAGLGAPLCAVVKSNGYGHGAVEAARAAQRGGAAWLAVATAVEAAELRAAGIDGPLLVLGALAPDELRIALEADADIVAWREAFVDGLPASARVHVKLDTGHGAARHARSGRGGAGRRRRGLAVGGGDDPFRHLGRRSGLHARAARAVRALGGPVRGDAPRGELGRRAG